MMIDDNEDPFARFDAAARDAADLRDPATRKCDAMNARAAAVKEAERCIEITAGILDDAGYVELAILCLDQAGLSVADQARIRRSIEACR